MRPGQIIFADIDIPRKGTGNRGGEFPVYPDKKRLTSAGLRKQTHLSSSPKEDPIQDQFQRLLSYCHPPEPGSDRAREAKGAEYYQFSRGLQKGKPVK
jgi:hypothetical protein